MEDHYKVLGLNTNATKDEIKEAFRKLAIKFHPDKHSQSPQAIRENATLRFKRVSEAYEVLSDDRKRANYNFRSSPFSEPSATGRSGYGYGSNQYYYYNNNYGNHHRGWNAKVYDSSIFESALQFLTTRAFLRNLSFACALLGGMLAIDMSMEAIWKMNNSGKSFEEAIKKVEAVDSVMEADKAMESTMKGKNIRSPKKP